MTARIHQRPRRQRLLKVVVLVTLCHVVTAARILVEERHLAGAERIPVLIGYTSLETLPRLWQPWRVRRAILNWTDIQALENDPNVEYVEPDYKVHRLGQVPAYGPTLIAADTFVPDRTLSSTADCSDANSLKIAIIDSGIDRSHPDLACGATNCIGQTFGLSANLTWYATQEPHGTMVNGIMGAMDNDVGIAGVVDGRDVCWIICRVFDDNSLGEAYLSDIFDSITWAVDQGANIVNLSLGGSGETISGQRLYAYLEQLGVLVVAAAGNEASSELSYPASYPSVMSVGAVDRDKQHASFSNYNSQVDVVAPGVNVLSTVPVDVGWSSVLLAEAGPVAVQAWRMGRSLSADASGTLVDCSNQGTCTGTLHVCLFQRSTVMDYDEQVANCVNGGGVAVIVYNNVEEPLDDAWLSTAVSIPVVGVRQSDGALLVEQVGQSAFVGQIKGYDYTDGTSFSAPFVSGAAAAIWQNCRVCQAIDIRNCLESSAEDLGDFGRDDYYGNGLINVQAAYRCLVDENGCCAPNATPAPTPTDVTAIPTYAPDECLPAEEVYQDCLQSLSSSTIDACVGCVNGFYPEDPDALAALSCNEVQSATCDGTLSCNVCGSCLPSIEEYFVCFFGYLSDGACVVQCSDPEASTPRPTRSPTLSPVLGTLAPSSAPTAALCPEETSAYYTCLSTQMTASESSSCANCVLDALNQDVFGCNNVQTLVCQAVETCSDSCAACLPEVTAVVTCGYGDVYGCNLSCNGPAPAPSLTTQPVGSATTAAPSPFVACPTEYSVYQSCFATGLSDTDASLCRACVNSALPSGSYTCNEFQLSVCSAIYEDCNCGVCAPGIEDFLSCLYQSNNCNLDCASVLGTPNPQPASPAMPPIAAPTSTEDKCQSENDAYQSCFATEMSEGQAASCRSCVNSGLPTGSATCAELQTSVCFAAYNDCNCQPCAGSVEKFLACVYQTTSCQLDCSTIPTPAPNVNTPSSSSSSLCFTETSLYAECLASQVSEDQLTSCQSCFEDLVSQSTFVAIENCSQLKTAVCTRQNQCNCQACSDKIADLLICQYGGLALDGCSVGCTGGEPSPSVQAPQPFPAAAPTVDASSPNASSSCNLLFLRGAMLSVLMALALAGQ